MSNSSFDGMVEVNSKDAVASAYACICHIERARNEYFEEDVQELLENPTICKWHHEEYEFNWRKPFRSYPIILDWKSACDYIRQHIKWYNIPKWHNYYEMHEMWCNQIIKMRELNETMFLTPQQASILHEFPVKPEPTKSVEDVIKINHRIINVRSRRAYTYHSFT